MKPAICGMCGSDEELVLVRGVVGQIIIGIREDGSAVGDGGPEEYDPTESQMRQHIWCGSCCEMVTVQAPA